MTAATNENRYGTIAGNKSINAKIYRCFELIHEKDAAVFVKLFRDLPHDGNQVLHTFRELLLGAFLNSVGVPVRYSQTIDGRTPDWARIAPEGTVTALVELVNFHAPHLIERSIEEHSAAGQVWVSRVPDHSERLISRLDDKSATYREIVTRREMPYVIGVFAGFESILELRDVEAALQAAGADWFLANSHVSGIIHFEEHSGTYSFQYLANPHALWPYHIPIGIL